MEQRREISFGIRSFQLPVRRSRRHRAIRPARMSFGNAWQQPSVSSATENREERNDWWYSKDAGRGLKPIAVFVVKGRKENQWWGNRREVYTGLCSVAIYPTQWSRTSTLAAEDKERKRSGPGFSPLFKQRIPCVHAACVLCRAIT